MAAGSGGSEEGMSDKEIQEKLQAMFDGLSKLREPFPDRLISKLPKPTISYEEWKKLPKGLCKECGGWHATTCTIHLDYVGHAALTDRLLDSDITWSWEPLAFTEHGLPRFDETGGLWIKLTVCGHTRLGYGNAAKNTHADVGSREKEVIGDALRNAAMRFGAALDLWHKGGDLHGDEDEEKPVKKPEPKPDPESVKILCSADSLEQLQDLYVSLKDASSEEVSGCYNRLKNIFSANAEHLPIVWKEIWTSLGEEGSKKYEGAKNRRKKTLGL